MRPGKIHIGTSGWSYKHWKDIFYPEGLKTTEWLQCYAQSFDCTEINNSFYRMPGAQTVLDWAEKVPAGFKFCPKISRYLSHMKKLKDPEEPMQRFFGVFSQIKKQLGPILIQLPPNLGFNEERTTHFFRLLKDEYNDYEFALEVRHETWLSEEALKLMKRYNVAFVISQSGVGFPYAEVVTAKHIYIRFHGPKKLYASLYAKNTLQEYAEKMVGWQKAGHHVWAFFNNDIHGYAIENARQLIGFTGK
jgi:uncharacterized protein YecE (DUF72 family)